MRYFSSLLLRFSSSSDRVLFASILPKRTVFCSLTARKWLRVSWRIPQNEHARGTEQGGAGRLGSLTFSECGSFWFSRSRFAPLLYASKSFAVSERSPPISARVTHGFELTPSSEKRAQRSACSWEQIHGTYGNRQPTKPSVSCAREILKTFVVKPPEFGESSRKSCRAPLALPQKNNRSGGTLADVKITAASVVSRKFVAYDFNLSED